MLSHFAQTRLSWHGWPTHSALAESLVPGCPMIDVKQLHKPHELCGSGFAIQCSTTMLFAALASIELGTRAHEVSVPRPLALPIPGLQRLQVLQNGGCFLSALHVCLASIDEQRLWGKFLRNSVSAPLDVENGLVLQERLKFEEMCFSAIYIYCMYTYTHMHTYIFIFIFF